MRQGLVACQSAAPEEQGRALQVSKCLKALDVVNQGSRPLAPEQRRWVACGGG